MQKNLYDTTINESEKENNLIIEFDSEWSQGSLNEVLSQKNLISLQFNGGTYIATFDSIKTMNDFMADVIENNIPVNYMRNISNSTRRFFVS